MRIWSKLIALLSRRKLETDMAEEMRLHLELQAEIHRRAGMSADEARFAAQRQFGNVASIQEQARDQRGWLWLEQGWQDLRYAARGLARSPGFTSTAGLTLALGIGVTTAMFSLVYGVLLDPYPYAKSSEIWAPEVTDAKTNNEVGLLMEDYLQMSRLPGVSSAMATSWGRSILGGGLNPEVITTPGVTGTAFDFLGVAPVIGRGLLPSDVGPGGQPQPVAVLSFKLWQRLFNGDPGVLGRTVLLDDQPRVIVGVMPPRFGWYTDDGLWLPLSTGNLRLYVRPIARFRAGVTKEVAGAQLLGLVQSQAQKDPGRFPPGRLRARFNNYLDVTVSSGAMRASLLVLFCAVGFLLVIACTNVANLQLARGAGRSREMALRLALGAGRGRLVRQLLTENIGLSVGGGLLGILFAVGLVHLVVSLMPAYYVPNEARVTVNGWVLAFSVGISALTGALFGLFPALQCTRLDLNEALKDGGHGAGSLRGGRTRNMLVVVEVALSVILLVGASLAIRGFVQSLNIDRGFRIERMLALRVPLQAKRYTTVAQRNGFAQDFLASIRTLPGVLSATLGVPPGWESGSSVTIPGETKPAEGLALNFVESDYLTTLGIPLREGRNLTADDVTGARHVALISEAAAKLWTHGESPVGRTFSVDSLVGGDPDDLAPEGAVKEVTVVGIIADTHGTGTQRPAPLAVLLPFTLRGATHRVFVVRTAAEPSALLNSLRARLRALDKEQPMDSPFTFADAVEQEVKQPKFTMSLFSVLAGIALALAAAGIYSVLSYNVAQRRREIGVRMALGADRGNILRLILGAGGRLLGVGLLIGLAGSLALARIVNSQVFSGPLLDPVPYVGALVLLGAAALLACYFPARRATKVEPMVALRAE
jgi:putative ABC transport system permease protein